MGEEAVQFLGLELFDEKINGDLANIADSRQPFDEERSFQPGLLAFFGDFPDGRHPHSKKVLVYKVLDDVSISEA